ncbi:predicted protein [Chaetoceros tenuissimus]|uniref:Uncharacterized protein n=1 Tax=Chaetoceros tenuissimus TaxID=426638 RepID=A0AAD3CEZ4_9STRA|nr:predicted protein [Chaetoceros tenuissimus]
MSTTQESMITEAAKFIQSTVQEEEEEADDKWLCLLFPIIGICIYIGLCSGYIPSPLYNRGERWPIWYQALQLLLLCLTIGNLDWSAKKEQEELWLDDLAEMTHFLGTNMWRVFYKEGGFMKGLVNAFYTCIYTAAFYIVAKGIEKLETKQVTKKLQHEPKKEWSMALIFLRNLSLFTILTILSVQEDLEEGDISLWCDKVNPEGDFLPPTMDQAKQSMIGFLEAWKTFHPAHLWGVRISHAFLYPTILIMLTRRSLSKFLMWFIFNEIDVFHLLADMTHYASGPELAYDRIQYQGDEAVCYAGVYTMQTILAYPLNFVYLATGIGNVESMQQTISE